MSFLPFTTTNQSMNCRKNERVDRLLMIGNASQSLFQFLHEKHLKLKYAEVDLNTELVGSDMAREMFHWSKSSTSLLKPSISSLVEYVCFIPPSFLLSLFPSLLTQQHNRSQRKRLPSSKPSLASFSTISSVVWVPSSSTRRRPF